MKLRDVDLHGALTECECAAIIQHNLTKETHVAFERIADRVGIRGLGGLSIEELAVRLTALFLVAGVDWPSQSSRRRDNPGTPPLRELLSEDL